MIDSMITVVGNLVDNPTLRSTSKGDAVAGLRVAATPRWFDRSSNEWKDGESLFIGVTCWRTLASHAAGSLRKGDAVVVVGRLRMRRWETKEGEGRTAFEIEADTVGPDLCRTQVSVLRKDRAEPVEAPDGVDPVTGEIADPEEAAPFDPRIALPVAA